MTRTGFDRAFLTVDVPLPDSTNPAITVLDYTHFSVGLNSGRRLAAWTAVNIDGAHLVEVPRGDDWHLDPRVAPDQQVGEELYRRNDLDRGHLVRVLRPVSVAPPAVTSTGLPVSLASGPSSPSGARSCSVAA